MREVRFGGWVGGRGTYWAFAEIFLWLLEGRHGRDCVWVVVEE